MAKVLVSLPDEVLREIDEYRNNKGLKRNQFFIDAVNTFFLMKKRDEYFIRKKNAIKDIKRIQESMKKYDLKGWDPVKEIRKARDERAN